MTDVATALKWAREFGIGPNSPAQVLADALETAEKERDAARRQLARITVDPSPPDIEVWNGLRALEGLEPVAEVPAWHVVDERDQAIRERDAALAALRDAEMTLQAIDALCEEVSPSWSLSERIREWAQAQVDALETFLAGSEPASDTAHGPVAQQEEQEPFKLTAAGSSPARPTSEPAALAAPREPSQRGCRGSEPDGDTGLSAGSEPTEAERPPESVLRYFRKLHGLPEPPSAADKETSE